MNPPHANATPRPVLGRLRTASAEGNVEIRSPIPDQQTMMGAYVKNIEKLEQSAEELSQGGSDIGEEIRKMKQEQDRASRRSSLASREGRSEGRRSISAIYVQTRSRNASASSYSNSIVDVNTAARWGGYSPGGYLTSPSVSRVSSFHRPSGLPEPVQEGRPLDSPLASPTSPFGPGPTRRPSQQSISRSHHEDIMSEHLSEPLERHDETREEHDEEWDLIRQQQEEEEEHVRQQHMEEHMGQDMDQHPFQDHFEEGQGLGEIPYVDNFRSSTPDTYRQARTLFQDFDGVHFSPTNGEFVELDASGNEVNRVSSQEFKQQVLEQQIMQNQLMQQQRLSQLPRPTSYAHPSHPPPEGMVYYPAPVPRMLNLPKRLSQVPAANVHAQRRSQIMQPPRAEARKSASWLPALDFQTEDEHTQPEPEPDFESAEPHSPQLPSPRKQRQSMMNPRLSRMSMANMPPQLRASVYFDQSGSVQLPEVRVKSESAVATLDSILAASVNAPVNVFTDHPFAGPDSRIYAKAPPSNRRSNLVDFAKSADPSATEPRAEEGHKRAVSTGTIAPPASGYQKRNSIVSMLTDLGNPGGKKLKKRNSKMSLATDLGLYAGEEQNLQRTASGESGELAAAHEERTGLRSRDDLDLDAGAEDDEDTYAEDVFDERYPFAVQPSTLLAELQMRKAHQKTRNRNATGYPNGMHSTLLQMDAVAQVEKAKKQSKRTRLAWEGPAQDEDQEDEDEDEDVPLGVLFPARDGLANRGRTNRDWNRPIGLLERRELEDHEPLARRRNRLRGISPDHHLRMRAQQQALLRQQYEAEAAAAAVALPPDEEDEHADEPLGQRLQRLKRKQALNAALGDLAGEDESKRMSAFTDDVLGQFGVADLKEEENKEEISGAKAAEKSPPTPEPAVDLVPEEEETLGQRRARMQREKSGLQQDGQRNISNPESAGASTIRPPLKTSVSLANLLAVHPVNTNATAVRSRHEPVSGSLLAMNSKAEIEAKQKLKDQNARSNSYNVLPREAMSSSKSMPQGFSQNQSGVAMYQQQLQMQQQQMQQQQMQQMQYAQQQQQMYPQMTAGMGTMGMQYNPMMYPQFAQPTAYAGMNMGMPNGGTGLLQQNMYGQMPAMQSYNTGIGAGVGSHLQRQMGQPQASTEYEEAKVPDARRDLIDRWRLSVAQ